VPPPIKASRKRSSGRPLSVEWKVIMMIIAEMAASLTPTSSRPRNTATAIARTTTSPACKAPTPTAETIKSAIATDAEGHPERELQGAPETLADGEAEADDGRYGGEGGPFYVEEQDREEPRRAGGHGGLEDLQPPAFEEQCARA
jgi:hypothetical protein